MENSLSIIKQVIEEHGSIREHLKTAGNTINELESIQSLQKIRRDGPPNQIEILPDKLRELQQSISSLEAGLGNHFEYEEKVLPPLLGELLMRALILTHQQIRKEINEVKSITSNLNLQGLNHEWSLASTRTLIYPKIDNIYQMIKDHSSKEEMILEMVQLVLQEKEQA